MNKFNPPWQEEVLEHFGLSEFPVTNLGDRPKNPKTGMFYTDRSWRYWLWRYSLNEKDAGILADLEAQD